MANDPIAAKEEARYFTPLALNRIPVSEYDWGRLRQLANTPHDHRSWPSFARSLALGVLASSILNIAQLLVLMPSQGYPAWVWVVAVGLLLVSGVAALFSHLLSQSEDAVVSQPLAAIAQEIERIEGTFVPPEPEAPARHSSILEPHAAGPDKGTDEDAVTVESISDDDEDASIPLAWRRPNPRYKKWAFKPDDRVHHKVFGEGKVVSVSNDKVTVMFDSGGTKNLLLGYAPMWPVGVPPDSLK